MELLILIFITEDTCNLDIIKHFRYNDTGMRSGLPMGWLDSMLSRSMYLLRLDLFLERSLSHKILLQKLYSPLSLYSVSSLQRYKFWLDLLVVVLMMQIRNVKRTSLRRKCDMIQKFILIFNLYIDCAYITGSVCKCPLIVWGAQWFDDIFTATLTRQSLLMGPKRPEPIYTI